nr:hypothetical protein [Tanacetum cinerariifolium]
SFENLFHERDDIMNVDCDDEYENQGNNDFVKDVYKSFLNQLVLTVLIDHIRLLSNQVTSLVNEHVNLKDMVNKLITSPVPSTEALVAEVVKCVNASFSSLKVEIKNGMASGQKEIKDEVNELKKSLSLKSSTYDITKEAISIVKQKLKNIKDHISKIETPSFPSKESLVVDNLANKTQENVSTFKEFCNYFSNLQNSINVLENLIEESILTKKEREEDQQLLDVILLDQGIIKGKISKIAECMLLIVKWAKSICVDDSTSIAKIIVAYEEVPLKQAEFDKDFTELPLDLESNVIPASTIQEPTSSVLLEDVCHERPQTETSSHVVVVEIHTTSAQKEGKQHILSHKPDDTFRYGASGVEHVMTSEEIAKQKEYEEIIKRKNEENKASYAEVLRVIEEEARSLQIQKNSAIRAEEDKQLQIKFKN